LQFRGVRIWHEPDIRNRDLTPGLWYSEFSYYKLGSAGWGELHWNFVHYPWENLQNDVEKNTPLSEHFKETVRKTATSYSVKKETLNRRNERPTQDVLADYIVEESPILHDTKTAIWRSLQTYLKSDDSKQDFRLIAQDRINRSSWVTTSESKLPFFRGYVFSETSRGWAPYKMSQESRKGRTRNTFDSPQWCLSGRYVAVPMNSEDEKHEGPCPLQGDLLFFRLPS
jgi:hypothetical protein